MDLQLNQGHASIEKLESPKLGDMVILTGKNGSGKTHLLEAINEGKVSIMENGASIPANDILYVGFGELNVTGADTYNFQQANQACTDVWNHFNSWRNNYESEGRPGRYVMYIQRFRNANNPQVEQAMKSIEYTLSKETNVPLEEITRYHFWKHIFDPTTSTADIGIFEQNFAKLFAEYQISLTKQRYYRYLKRAGYDNAPAINMAELRVLEGDKPWDFVNEVLEVANFDFRVMPPDFWDTEEFDYRIKLKKLSSGAEVEFSRLSTGEKVLFAMALVRYKAERRTNRFPRVIMFDEPDAPLHPAMTQSLLDVVRNVFVTEYNTHVILTTHSPATVALAPESTVYVTRLLADPITTVIEASSKQGALDTLSSGFIATSNEENQERLKFEVGESNAPVLFVEGPTDRDILTTAWAKLYRQTRMPFTILRCGNADQMRHKLDAEYIDDMHGKYVCGIMDFDSAYDQFNGTKRFDNAQGTDESGLFKERRNGQKKITLMLLPVPATRAGLANRTMKSKSLLEIELLFTDDVLRNAGYLREVEMHNGVKIPQFSDKSSHKTKFATKVVPTLAKNDFEAFKPLFQAIKRALRV